MEKKIALLVFSVVCFMACVGDGGKSDDISNAKTDAIEGQIDTLIREYQDLDLFSGVVLLAEKGKPKYLKAFGMADREKQINNTAKTLFDIGSMNKTFTSIVIKQLINEGKLAYDDKLIKYVEGFEDRNAKNITIQHLLKHESGFGDYHNDGYFDLSIEQKSLQAIVDKAKKMELLFKPGEENEYSNTGYVILGAVIEAVSGKSYFENVRERIVEPLGLKNTYIQNLDKVLDRRAFGYFPTPLGVLERNVEFIDVPNPDGGFLATIEDVMKFYRSYYNDTILLNEKIKSADSFFQYVRELPAGKAPLTAGGFEGFNTAMYQVLNDDISILVFANMDEPVAELIATGILEITRGNDPEPARMPAMQGIRIAFEERGVDYVKSNFEDLTINYHPEDPKDWILNDLGYAYLFAKEDTEKAVALFQLNTELFPEVANAWDSYGEGLLQQGKRNEALNAYWTALKLDPKSPTALKMVRELKSR
jgi:CubicO group peptidase (beta-lactamase class C family)